MINAAWYGLMNLIGLLMEFTYESSFRMCVLSSFMAAICLLHLSTSSILLTDFMVPRGGHHQMQASPINIVRNLVNEIYQTHENQLVWKNYECMPGAVFMQNNGTTVVMHITAAPDSVPYLCGGSLPGKYFFVEATFKWGGSEHLIDSRRFSFEMQVLHATNISNSPFEYLCISYLFVTTHHKCLAMEQVVNSLAAIANAGSFIEMPPFDLPTLFWPFNSGYYSYKGSYTNGLVVLPAQWFVCTSIFHISAEQVNKFNIVKNPDALRIARNSRSEVPLGNRRVNLYSFL